MQNEIENLKDLLKTCTNMEVEIHRKEFLNEINIIFGFNIPTKLILDGNFPQQIKNKLLNMPIILGELEDLKRENTHLKIENKRLKEFEVYYNLHYKMQNGKDE